MHGKVQYRGGWRNRWENSPHGSWTPHAPQRQSKPFYFPVPVSNSLSSSHSFSSLLSLLVWNMAWNQESVGLPWRLGFMFPTLRTKNQVFFWKGKTFSKKCQHLFFSPHQLFASGSLFLFHPLRRKPQYHFLNNRGGCTHLTLCVEGFYLMWLPTKAGGAQTAREVSVEPGRVTRGGRVRNTRRGETQLGRKALSLFILKTAPRGGRQLGKVLKECEVEKATGVLGYNEYEMMKKKHPKHSTTMLVYCHY